MSVDEVISFLLETAEENLADNKRLNTENIILKIVLSILLIVLGVVNNVMLIAISIWLILTIILEYNAFRYKNG